MFFTGTHTPKLDDKGRLFLPAKFRDLLTEDVMIAPGQEHCLQVWSLAGFQSMTSDLARKSQADKMTRQHIRYLFSNSSRLEPDKQGRVLLPEVMRKRTALDREVTMVGVRDVSAQFTEPARSMQASERQLLWQVVLPASFPFIAAGIKLALGRALTTVIVAEFFVSVSGLGGLLHAASTSYQMALMFAPVIILAAMGIAIDAAVTYLEQSFLRRYRS